MGLQPIGMGLKLLGMGWGLRNFCWDGVGMALMSTTLSLFSHKEKIKYNHLYFPIRITNFTKKTGVGLKIQNNYTVLHIKGVM